MKYKKVPQELISKWFMDKMNLSLNKEQLNDLCSQIDNQVKINYTPCCDKLPQDPIELARYLHEAYEMIAKKQNWNTQESCKVDFSDLPVGNKNTMILLAGKLILDFGGN